MTKSYSCRSACLAESEKSCIEVAAITAALVQADPEHAAVYKRTAKPIRKNCCSLTSVYRAGG
ncbi:MAG: hypothetical protein ACLRXQ_11085 [Phascolarctobacterium faecium]